MTFAGSCVAMVDAVLIGGGGHAGVVLNAMRRNGMSVLGYVAPALESRMSLPYLGTDVEFTARSDARRCVAVLGIGKTRASDGRLAVLEQFRAAGFRFPAVVAPGAIVHEGVTLGEGSVVLDGAVIVTGAELGQACIVNTNATVDHDCKLGDDVHIAPGATLSGAVAVGHHCMIGAGATLIQSIRVCADCLIGAGATVVADITVPGTWIGTPARKSR